MKNSLLTMFTILLIAGCTPVETQQSDAPTITTAETQESASDEIETTNEAPVGEESDALAEESEQEMALSVKEFNMVARQWDFEPSTITVNEGDTVLLYIQRVDVGHGFGLSAFGINEYLAPGQTVDVEFVADQKGTFQFACSVSCGSGHSGMKGQLIVE